MRAIESKRGFRTDPFNNSLGWICCELAPLAKLAFKRSNSPVMSVCLIDEFEIEANSMKVYRLEKTDGEKIKLTLLEEIAMIFWLLLRPFISLDERENEGITKTDV